MTNRIFTTIISLLYFLPHETIALSSGDISIRLNSGYYWLDNSCTAGGPQGKVLSYRIVNTKGSKLYGVNVKVDSLKFVAAPSITTTGGTPSFALQAGSSYYIGDIEAGDSATAFFYVGYNCITYPNNTNLTTDSLRHYTTFSDAQSGVLKHIESKLIYVMRNANNNTITILATSLNTVGTLAKLSVAYAISNVKPGNIIDMQISTLPTFPAGYQIVGCEFTASSITADFPVGMKNTFYSQNIVSNLPSGGTVTIEWTLKITGSQTGLNSSNLVPFVVSDAGSAQRWQANVTSFTGTSIPVNPIVMTKKADVTHHLVGDTVQYTIVIHNTSTTADISIDMLMDHLPRDYKYRYLNTDTSVYPDPITYMNSTAYPIFEDTSYLAFYGMKPLGTDSFTWVIRKSDSIQLVYTAQVSSTIGMNDTNFISAYIGGTEVASAFAVTHVLSVLPIRVLYYKAEKEAVSNTLRWAVSGDIAGMKEDLYAVTGSGERYLLYSNLVYSHDPIHYQQFEDFSGSPVSYYVLRLTEANGLSYELSTEILNENIVQKVWYNASEDALFLYSSEETRELEIEIYSVGGKQVYTGNLSFESGMAVLPMSDIKNTHGILFVKVNKKGREEVYRVLRMN